MTESNELVVHENSPAAMIQAAISGNADLEKLEKLMQIQERWEANEAKKAYVVAMAAFKANPPRIEKTKQVSFATAKGKTEYKHALLADAAEIINKALSANGLSATWKTCQQENKITVTCMITHKMGHSESTSLTASPDDSGGKNSIQAIGSTVSYLERYTLFSLTGLASHDMDDDGAKTETISDEQANTLHALINDNDMNADGKYLPRLLAYLKVDTLDDLLARDFIKAQTAIKQAIAKRGAK